jgi:hypothetical protein
MPVLGIDVAADAEAFTSEREAAEIRPTPFVVTAMSVAARS